MWDYFVKDCNGGVKPDMNSCLFVGDAAGTSHMNVRVQNLSHVLQEDLQDGHTEQQRTSQQVTGSVCLQVIEFMLFRAFAVNVGLKFQTPDEFFFHEQPAPFVWDSVDPAKLLDEAQ